MAQQQQARTAAQVTRTSMRNNAVKFAQEHADDHSEKSHSQLFWADFFQIFGRSARQAAVYEKAAKRASTGNTGSMDVLVASEMGIEQKSKNASEDVDDAMSQLYDYLPGLTTNETPWLLIGCDFETFKWENLDNGEAGEFALDELPDNLDLFEWLAGYGRPDEERYVTDEAANIKATRLLAKVHDELASVGYPAHDLRVWMTRLLFCLFADDSDIWPRGSFHAWLTLHTRQDGADLGPQVLWLHDLLNTDPDNRPKNLDPEHEEFTYVNGELFDEACKPAPCNEVVREAILDACRFEWSEISPAVFGSMFQQVMTPVARHDLGAHYTGEQSIRRVIDSLFLDDLRAELKKTKTKPKLEEFLTKIGKLKFLDPACGCGNFLVVTYKELRKLETAALAKLLDLRGTGQALLDATTQLTVTVDQFYGMEIEEFPARIARTAMYLADHLANRQLLQVFGQTYARFPIQDTPHIVQGNANSTDWNTVLPAEECDYVVGNPPFSGNSDKRPVEQTNELKLIWGKGYSRWLDYVTCWYRIAFTYGRGQKTRFAFVSTNSLTQGEQPARLWNTAFDDNWRIDFGHRTFPWTSDARGKAVVHVVIIGFSHEAAPDPSQRHVVEYDRNGTELRRLNVKTVSPYLTDGPQLAVQAASRPLSPSLPAVQYGNKPSDDGNLNLKADERPTGDPVAMKYIRKYVGAKELTSGTHRYCIWMPDGPDPGDLKKSKFLADRVAAVRAFRENSTAADTRKMAAAPYRFFRIPQPQYDYVAMPAQVTANRTYFTVDHLSSEVIASNNLYFAEDPDGFLFGLMSSSMYIAWMKGIGGRIKSDIRFSNSIVHNPFPLPSDISTKNRKAVAAAGKAVLKARPTGTALEDMYDPNGMTPALISAHKALDKVVDRAIAPRRTFAAEPDRVALLLTYYKKLLTGDQLAVES